MKHKLLFKLAIFLLENKDKIIVYVAGKVTGLPYDEVYFKFKQAQERLEAEGYAVLNPCEWMSADTDWKKAMRDCLVLIGGAADHLFLLDDWSDSKGAKIEKLICKHIGIDTLHYLEVEG